jgi:hypothetical protein
MLQKIRKGGVIDLAERTVREAQECVLWETMGARGLEVDAGWSIKEGEAAPLSGEKIR